MADCWAFKMQLQKLGYFRVVVTRPYCKIKLPSITKADSNDIYECKNKCLEGNLMEITFI